MGQSLEMLLAADPGKIKAIPRGQLEIPRLSKICGKPFVVSFRAGTLDELNHIGEQANGNDAEEMKWAVYELVTDPDFKSRDLQEKFDVARPVDVVSAILLGGEIAMIYRAITKLSGFDRQVGVDIEEVKN